MFYKVQWGWYGERVSTKSRKAQLKLKNILKNYFYGVGRVAPQIASELSEQIIRASAVAALLIYFSPSDAGVSAMLIIIGMVISELFSSSLLSCFYKKSK